MAMLPFWRRPVGESESGIGIGKLESESGAEGDGGTADEL